MSNTFYTPPPQDEYRWIITVEKALWHFLPILFLFMLGLLGTRLWEWLTLSNKLIIPAFQFQFLWQGFLNDLALAPAALVLIFFFYFIIALIHQRSGSVVGLVLCIVFILIQFSLSKYFQTTLNLLGADAFAYSMAEVREILNTSGALSGLTIAGILVLILVCVGLYVLFFRLKISASKLFFIYAFVLFCFAISSSPGKPGMKEIERYALVNKLDYFGGKSYEYWGFKLGWIETNILEEEYRSDEKLSLKDTAYQFTYTDAQYPLLHRQHSPDVLSPFFSKPSKKPNIVFIIIESMGRAYSGPGAYLGSFTPFLDSLAMRGLYWENGLSTAGRTFAVLPSLIGSLPFGEKGFLELGDRMPTSTSLYTDLKADKYTTRFFYGGKASFDNMEGLLKKHKVEVIIDDRNYGSGYEKLPSGPQGDSWGYGDKELFKKDIELRKASKDTNATMTVLLTVANHSPFLVQNQNYYLNLFRKKLKLLNVANEKEYESYAAQYSCILYTDDAIRQYISAFSKLPEYNNTIFVITGDHRMPEIPLATKIDRFHVPIIIYSPLLHRSAKFPSIVSHFDVRPSLEKLLETWGYNSIKPEVSWMGSGLDTARTFRNVHEIAFMRNKNEMVEYASGLYFISDDQLYKIQSDMGLDPVTEPEKLAQLKNKLSSFKNKNREACLKNKLEK